MEARAVSYASGFINVTRVTLEPQPIIIQGIPESNLVTDTATEM